MIKLQAKMELQMKQRGNLMMRDEVTRQMVNYTMRTAVKKCLHLCTEVTALCRDILRRLILRTTCHWNFVALGE
jgi:hypothetical protein